jgi:hypothetical protein
VNESPQQEDDEGEYEPQTQAPLQLLEKMHRSSPNTYASRPLSIGNLLEIKTKQLYILNF